MSVLTICQKHVSKHIPYREWHNSRPRFLSAFNCYQIGNEWKRYDNSSHNHERVSYIWQRPSVHQQVCNYHTPKRCFVAPVCLNASYLQSYRNHPPAQTVKNDIVSSRISIRQFSTSSSEMGLKELQAEKEAFKSPSNLGTKVSIYLFYIKLNCNFCIHLLNLHTNR